MISIIVAVLNGSKTLDFFLQNLENQTYQNFELIIVEGGSTDDTLGVLHKYSKIISHLKIIDAVRMYPKLNEGIKCAKGDWLYFMGCDDYFFDNSALQRVLPFLDSTQYDYVSGAVKQMPSGKLFFPRPLTQWLFHSLHHQGTFYHQRVFEKFSYNENFNIASDYELTLRIYLKKYRLKIIREIIACFNETGISGTHPRLAWAECDLVRIGVYGRLVGTTLNFLVHRLLYIKKTMKKIGVI